MSPNKSLAFWPGAGSAAAGSAAGASACAEGCCPSGGVGSPLSRDARLGAVNALVNDINAEVRRELYMPSDAIVEIPRRRERTVFRFILCKALLNGLCCFQSFP